MKSIRRHLNYANVVATLALLFAMTGGALAANHYLINSTKQINPKVLKKLKGQRGRTGFGIRGQPGPTGKNGGQGPKGADGAKGTDGTKGERGEVGQSALLPLPSGQTESGAYGQRETNGTVGGFMGDSVTYPIRLAEKVAHGQAVYTPSGTPTSHCSGPGHADAGFLCIYSLSNTGVSTPQVENYEEAAPDDTAGRLGFILEWKLTSPEPFDFGTYTVTAG